MEEIEQGNTIVWNSRLRGWNILISSRSGTNAPESINVLVNKDSSVLPLLKVGDTLDSKYYSSDSAYPSKNMRTVIRHITKNTNGRLKGHYLVGLKIIEG